MSEESHLMETSNIPQNAYGYGANIVTDWAERLSHVYDADRKTTQLS